MMIIPLLKFYAKLSWNFEFSEGKDVIREVCLIQTFKKVSFSGLENTLTLFFENL